MPLPKHLPLKVSSPDMLLYAKLALTEIHLKGTEPDLEDRLLQAHRERKAAKVLQIMLNEPVGEITFYPWYEKARELSRQWVEEEPDFDRRMMRAMVELSQLSRNELYKLVPRER